MFILSDSILPSILESNVEMSENEISVMIYTMLKWTGHHFNVLSDIVLKKDKLAIDYIVFQANNPVLEKHFKE